MISVREGAQFMEFTDDDLEGGTDVRGFVVPESVPASNSELAAAIEQIRPDHGADMVILAADHTVAVQLLRLTVALGKSALLTERLIDAMFVPGSTASPAAAHQAQRNAMARQALIDEFGLHSADEIAELSGSTASNRSATASRWLASKRIFTVSHQGVRLYPGFQFGTDGQPRRAIAPVLAAFEPYGLDGWEVALWFTTGSGWLDDERPVDLLTRAPERVTAAAEHAFEEPVG
jgi:hypothetical protein